MIISSYNCLPQNVTPVQSTFYLSFLISFINKSVMSQVFLENQNNQREVAESSYEYLLGEILSLNYPTKANDQNASIVQRLDSLGYDVGYR